MLPSRKNEDVFNFLSINVAYPRPLDFNPTGLVKDTPVPTNVTSPVPSCIKPTQKLEVVILELIIYSYRCSSIVYKNSVVVI